MKIHLKSRQGMYTVVNYGRDSITLQTKHAIHQVPSTDFQSFAGGSWAECTDEEKRLFLSVVAPHLLQQTLETEAKIKALASLIDIQEKAKETASEYISAIAAQQGEEYENTVLNTDDLDYYNPCFDHDTPTYEEYKSWYESANEKAKDLDQKMRSIARQVYSQNLDFTHFQNHDGIKFIIQQDHVDEHSYRLCWDPYGFVSNGHSDISSIYRDNHWGTINGGWIRIIDNDVILYYKSGDYGVYDDAIAIECAKKLFPGKKIHSFAGRQWDIELDVQFPRLPF